HCGLIPHLVNEGYRRRIIATRGTCELAELVLLDSGKLQEEFAKREARWERKHPDRAAADDRKEQEAYQEALDIAAGKVPAPVEHETVDDAPPIADLAGLEKQAPVAPEAATVASASVSEEVPAATANTTPVSGGSPFRGGGDPDMDVEHDL